MRSRTEIRDRHPCPGTNVIFCDDFESGGLGAWSAASSGQTLRHTDYFHRGSQLLAVATDDGETRHFSLDHLGTPRVVTNDFGELGSRHDYFPYGEEISSDEQDGEVMKFTGHERDRLGTTQGAGATADDLDYMHARHNSPLTGRSLSFDPAASWGLASPQTWNRYSYTAGNPVVAIDATGREMLFLAPTAQELFQNGVEAGIAEFQNLNSHFADGSGNIFVVARGETSLDGVGTLAGSTFALTDFWNDLGPDEYAKIYEEEGPERVEALQTSRTAMVVRGTLRRCVNELKAA